tara:strand:- start:328 stop:522 length:195 start_codon:yes stop_codon:yes gene_type:complete
MFKNKNTNINTLNEGSMYFRATQTDVLNIIKRNKLEEKQLKRKNIILGVATVSVLVISGLLISL